MVSSYSFIGSLLSYTVTGDTQTVPVSGVTRDGIYIRNLSEDVVIYASASSGITEETSIFEPILPGNSEAFGFRSGNVYLKAYTVNGVAASGFVALAHPFFETNVVTRMLQTIGTNIVNETSTDCSCEPQVSFCGMAGADASYTDYSQLLVQVNYDLSTVEGFTFKVNGSEVDWATGTLVNAGVAGQQALGLSLSNVPLGSTVVSVYAELEGSTLGLFRLNVKGS